jgi:hypothetical protein
MGSGIPTGGERYHLDLSAAVGCLELETVPLPDALSFFFRDSGSELEAAADELEQRLPGAHQVARLHALALNEAVKRRPNLGVAQGGLSSRRLRFGQGALRLSCL